MLHSTDWQLLTDVSGKIDPVLKSQLVLKENAREKCDVALPKTEPCGAHSTLQHRQHTQDETTTWADASTLQDPATRSSFVHVIRFWPTLLRDTDMNQVRLTTGNLF
jgi:hypothetical protein